MSEWKSKRFWKTAEAVEVDGGWTVHLDGRSVKTPAKTAFVLPSKAMAQAAAEEWDAQEKEIQPLTMPVTRSANAALDKVSAQHQEVADLIGAYGESDLLCYRADGPDGLCEMQAKAWDPYLTWAANEYGAKLVTTAGMMPVPQDAESVAVLKRKVHNTTPFELTALHDLVSLSGSLILGLAAANDVAEADEIWSVSRVDEAWQESQWGPDEEAQEVAEKKRQAFLHAKRFLTLCSDD
ncbi:ATP12 family chaperone protein [Actibacterium pelagium]|uniref:ATPase n=1 Tax=Actibacterium pelagium TaxID=2029103 RepID=A0A917ABA0_9RHOB|nr:ATP12 family protein [Actibacterium pelagium]GGE36657.1 ATPase [Actibacterium pelagium]